MSKDSLATNPGTRLKDSVAWAAKMALLPDSTAARLTDSLSKKHTADSLRKIGDEADDRLKPVISPAFHVPIPGPDSSKTAGEVKSKKGRKKKEWVQPTPARDTLPEADSTAPLYFIGYHNVRIFNDSIQGKCDSVCYTRSDSLVRMMIHPVVWAHKSQVTGDTILMQLDSTTMRKMFVPNNAIIISQSGPEKAHMFDQVQGRTLTAYFASNTITEMIVKPDAQSIYYSKDEKDAYLGLCQSVSDRIFIHFDGQKIKNIKFDRDAHITLTPMEKADIPNARLSKFRWLMDTRPASKEELFR